MVLCDAPSAHEHGFRLREDPLRCPRPAAQARSHQPVGTAGRSRARQVYAAGLRFHQFGIAARIDVPGGHVHEPGSLRLSGAVQRCRRSATCGPRPGSARCRHRPSRRRAAGRCIGITTGFKFTLTDHPRIDENRRIPGGRVGLHAGVGCLPGIVRQAARAGIPVRLRRHRSADAVSPAAAGAQAVRAGAADGDRRRSIRRRRHLHRRIWPRQGAVPLGPPGKEGRKQLLLDSRRLDLGRQRLGRDPASPHQAGSHRRFPRGRPRPAHHYRAGLQRPQQGALYPAGQQDAKHDQVAEHDRRHDDTFNELRFEDKKGSEEIYFHAEKDFNRVVENNDTLKVGFDKKDKGDQTIEIFNNQTLTIGNNQVGRRQPDGRYLE